MILGMKNLVFSLYFSLVVVSAKTPLRTPIFENNDGRYRLQLPYESGTHISRYEIMEGKLGADAESFSPIHSSDKIVRKSDAMIIDITLIDRKSGKQYSISVTTGDGTYYSESFRFDETKNNYVLTRFYEGTPFYIKYGPHIGGGLLIGGLVVAIIYAVNRRRAKSEIEESL